MYFLQSLLIYSFVILMMLLFECTYYRFESTVCQKLLDLIHYASHTTHLDAIN